MLKITWLKDGKPLEAKTKFKPHYDIYTSLASLKIGNARPVDEGTYTCLAENNVGKDQTSADGVVIRTPNIDENSNIDPEGPFSNQSSLFTPNNITSKNFQPPKVIHPLSNLRIVEGFEIIFSCKF